MKVLNIYPLDEPENVITSLHEGKHVIGRGDLLQIRDKRVSRKHALISNTANGIKLTSTHQNPCFFIAANSTKISVLSQDQTTEIEDGMKFSLLPDDLWYQVKASDMDNEDKEIGQNLLAEEIENEKHNNNQNESTIMNSTSSNILPAQNANKRNLEYTTQFEENTSENSECKRRRYFSDAEDDLKENENESLNLTNREAKLETSTEQILNIEVKNEPKEETPQNENKNQVNKVQDETVQNQTGDLVPKKNDIKKENELTDKYNVKEESDGTSNYNDHAADNADPSVASGSGNNDNATKKTRRERCWYGQNCFRKNPRHRDDFSHPGDNDYDSDPNDDRPDCPFGAACYRRNIHHRREYKHPSRPAAKPTNAGGDSDSATGNANPPPPTKKKRKAAAKKTKTNDESSEDDYDLEDPFICEDDSDEFELSDDNDEDSEWEDSQEVDEDTQERKRLLKEAKRFTKAKK